MATWWVLAAAIVVCGVCEGGKIGKPNVVVILVDDLGYNDLSIQGSKDVKSPKIDQLMRDGARFSRAYSVAGFCSPARAGLLSGIHPFHFGHRLNPAHDMEDTQAGMPVDLKLLPQTLKQRGYATFAVGKWHLGFAGVHHPMNRGFDHFFGFLGGRFNYFEDSTYYGLGGFNEFLYDDWTRFKKVTYLTHDFGAAATKFMTKNRKKPFFIYQAYNAQHGPFEFLKRDVDKSVSVERRPHVAMIKALDRDVGKLRKHIAKLGLTKKTLIVFANDNGGHFRGARNKPLRDFKHSLFEGGLRVPFSLTWPGTIRKQQKINKLATLLDVYPTVQAAANVPKKQRNGKLQGSNLLRHVRLVGRSKPEASGATYPFLANRDDEGNAVVYQGNWKLFLRGRTSKAMYNLKADVGEKKDVLKKQRPRAKRMRKLYLRWNKKTKKAQFPADFVRNPITATITDAPKKARVGKRVALAAVGAHKKGRQLMFAWEVFRPSRTIFADFNPVKVAGSVAKISSKARRRTKIDFRKPGRWVVRVKITDGRFLKWTDVTVEVRR